MEEIIKKLEDTIEILFETNDICPDCYGKGSITKSLIEKSSDLREDCLRCKGTGKYWLKESEE